MSRYNFLTGEKLQMLKHDGLDVLEQNGALTADEIDYLLTRFDAWMELNMVDGISTVVNLFNKYPITVFFTFLQGYLNGYKFVTNAYEAENEAQQAIDKAMEK